jgi:hypothetical protein
MKISEPQLLCLKNLAEGRRMGAHLRGQSEHGGFTATLRAMRNRGWVTWEQELTDAGRALAVELFGKVVDTAREPG